MTIEEAEKLRAGDLVVVSNAHRSPRLTDYKIPNGTHLRVASHRSSYNTFHMFPAMNNPCLCVTIDAHLIDLPYWRTARWVSLEALDRVDNGWYDIWMVR
ncbi:MAG: hypothetical protein ACXABY_10835 [Candidatus Thorarchaeota archaeon]|jgi:hypothetical protein